jgi:hypothetical protein
MLLVHEASIGTVFSLDVPSSSSAIPSSIVREAIAVQTNHQAEDIILATYSY